MSENLRVFAIGAHPVDIFDQSAGTMLHHIERGDWVGCCVLTHGARVHDRVMSHEMFYKKEIPSGEELTKLMRERSDVKADEVKKACGILGIKDIFFFGADDAVLLPNGQIVRKLAALIRELKPNVILTHYPYELGEIWGPHSVAGQCTLMAIGYAASVDPDDKNPPHSTTQVYFWGQGAAKLPRTVMDTTRSLYNDVCIDISDVIEKKLKCMDELYSQAYDGVYARKRLETVDGAHGVSGRVAYAETFISWKMQVYRYLPVSEILLKMDMESEQDLRTKFSYRLKV